MSGSATTGQFTTQNGQIIGPNGQSFVAHGLDVMYGNNNPSAATLESQFPGINFVRLALYAYPSAQSLEAYVQDLTSHGIVVELEDHTNNAGNAGGSQGTIFTGSELTNELNWYSSIASTFASNPYVWFGTNNEPSEIDPSTGQTNAALLSQWQEQTYNAIRSAGNNSPVMLEANGWANNGQPQMLQGYNAADYAGMTNAIWDVHYYGWLTNYSTDQQTVGQFLGQMIQQVQQVTGADGSVMPVIIGEYGNSTTGSAVDANGDQVIQAVQSSGVGSAEWAYASNPSGGDALLNGDGSLSGQGQELASWIASQSAPDTATGAPPVTAPAAATAVPENAVLVAGSGTSISDVGGNVWTIANGVVDENGSAAGYSAGVQEIAYVSGQMWQENGAGLWWGWNGTAWTGTGTSTSPVPAASANDAVVTAGSSNSITDADGNAWTISDGVVDQNGMAAGYSANVTEIAYVAGDVWQENASDLWWEWQGTGWSAGDGTSTSPLPASTPTPTPAPTPTASPNDTTVAAGSGQAITDAGGNAWTIDATGQVDQNAAAAGYSANVDELAYVNGTVWQQNQAGDWWSWTGSGWSAGSGATTSPLPSTIGVTAGGQSDTISGTTTGSTTVDNTIVDLVAPGVAGVVVGSAGATLNFINMAAVSVIGGAGSTSMNADSGVNTFVAGAGAMTIFGGTGSDTYVTAPGAGSMTIADFSAAKGDTILAGRALEASFTASSDRNGGTLISFGNLAGSIDLQHVTAAPNISFV